MIIAVDFDGVLVRDEFPNIGQPNHNMIEAVKGVIEAGHEVVLWTCRVENELAAAVEWCEEHGIRFHTVNGAAFSNMIKYAGVYSTTPRKIYANYYIDDHGVGYSEEEAIALLEILRTTGGTNCER